MVFYFTGTGNSLYVAKQIEDAPISIPQAIHRKELDFSDESIGIVAPIYGHEVPPMVRDFMKKAAFHTDYFYMILTYGNRHGGAAELAKRLCDECGIDVQYINILWMVDNWLPSFDMDEQKRIDKKSRGTDRRHSCRPFCPKSENRAGYGCRSCSPSGISKQNRSDAARRISAFYQGWWRLHRLRDLRKGVSLRLHSRDRRQSRSHSRLLSDLPCLRPCLPAKDDRARRARKEPQRTLSERAYFPE